MLEEAEGINIRKITIPDAVRPMAEPFNPQQDVSEQEWQQVAKKREEVYREKNYGELLSQLFYLKMVSPSRFHAYNDTFPHAASFQWYILDRADLKDPSDIDAMALTYYVFGHELDVRDRVKELWGNMATLMEKSDAGDMKEFISLKNLFNLETLFPDKAVGWRKSMPHDAIKTKLADYKKRGDWVMYCKVGGLYKLLFPERASEIPVTKEDWAEIRKAHTAQKKSQFENGIDLEDMYYLTLLGGDNLKLTQEGLGYTPAESRSDGVLPQMPILKAA